jgi:hypothetical protein
VFVYPVNLSFTSVVYTKGFRKKGYVAFVMRRKSTLELAKGAQCIDGAVADIPLLQTQLFYN